MNIENLQRLAEKIYHNNVDKGWYEDSFMRYFEYDKILEIRNEISELSDAHKKGRFCRPDVIQSLTNTDIDELFKVDFSACKGTFEDELADIIIRCLDRLEDYGYFQTQSTVDTPDGYEEDLDEICKEAYSEGWVQWHDETMTGYEIGKFLFEMGSKVSDDAEDIKRVLLDAFFLAGAFKVPIMEHVHVKVRYNTLRPHRHGKSY